ncbi:MAG: ABC transporter ATP-binding protein [Berryella intestinalis]|uniref:ABC transporter ATP-binding protein n=1 Tax=Berryella intestinalis TaxID=1531429 RepID=UPI002A4EB7ED|nr:ABC transporter ATP-binding protein [Berryella intestinalis]MDD7369219.1 ABC transporter ATP-binding protein [Berryella intestinalis]MDY3129618.1 ABC transporter ATP-binding protein [Berryella intestinalis]
MKSQVVLEARNLGKTYKVRSKRSKGAQGGTRALDGVDFDVREGEIVGIMGPSGSGKSTLLNCISTIDRPDSGTVRIDGRDISKLGPRELALFRGRELGFIFQDSNLLDTLTCYENIALSLTIRKVSPREIDHRVRFIAQQLGIADVLDKFPYQVSGGQKQRVATARAVVGKPRLVLADEPTGALDSKSARALLETFERINRLGSTILMVTHDPVSASYCQRIVFIKDGKTALEITRDGRTREQFYADVVGSVVSMSEEAVHVC